MGPGRRSNSRTQSCFPTTENMLGVGLGRQRPPAKQQGPGSQGQPRPALPSGEWRAGVKTTCVDYLRRGMVRLWFAAGGEFPFAGCSSKKLDLGRHCDRTSALSGRAGSGCMAEAWAQPCPLSQLGRSVPRPRRTGAPNEFLGAAFCKGKLSLAANHSSNAPPSRKAPLSVFDTGPLLSIGRS